MNRKVQDSATLQYALQNLPGAPTEGGMKNSDQVLLLIEGQGPGPIGKKLAVMQGSVHLDGQATDVSGDQRNLPRPGEVAGQSAGTDIQAAMGVK